MTRPCAALNGRRSHGSRLRDSDEAALRELGRRTAAALLARGASRQTAVALARAADDAAARGADLATIAGELRLEVGALLAPDGVLP